MVINFSRRRNLILWQLAVLFIGTSWLWAPQLNHALSYRTSLISQYEVPFEPYSWLFRTADLVAASALALMGYYLARTKKMTAGWLMLIIAGGLILDPLLSTSCKVSGNTCHEYFSANFLLHAIETVITSLAVFIIAAYDAWVRKRLISILFVVFQVVYGMMFLSQLASQQHFNTISQFVYQISILLWLVWFGRDVIRQVNFSTTASETRLIRRLAAGWAFANGVLAIVVSLSHIHLLGRIHGVYFAGDTAWLAQHGIIVGVVLIYLSRHLSRGEMRARQIFLVLTALETLKYSLVAPNAALMGLYLVSFCFFFVLRDDFDRGTVPLTWELRIRDLYFMVGGLLLAGAAALISLDRDDKASRVANAAFEHLYDYSARAIPVPRDHLSSALLAHAVSVFLFASVASVVWILFRPNRRQTVSNRYNYDNVAKLLSKLSNSSEDYFKLWPRDKDYFWLGQQEGFVAYRRVGSINFALADPIAPGRPQALKDFLTWSRSLRLTACFLPVSGKTLKIYKTAGFETMQIGSSAVVEINRFMSETTKDKWWRWKVNRAEKAGYSYESSSPPHADGLLKQLKQVSDAWLSRDGRVERGFALGYFDEEYLNTCVIHYLNSSAGEVVAFTNQIKNFSRDNTETVDLMRHSPEANDAMPYLFYKTIQSVKQNSPAAVYFDLGFVPFAKTEGSILKIAGLLSAGRFSARGLEQFKNKFDPDWRPVYIAYDGDLTDLAAVAINIEKAMSLD